jgi:hypothetical protein
MPEPKTKKTKASVAAHLAAIPQEQLRKDAKQLAKIFARATGLRPAMWGTAIVGYGQYHYQSERSAQKGDWPLTAFAVRSSGLVAYIMPGFKQYQPLLKKLGKHKTTVSCLSFKKLADIDENVLEEIIRQSVAEMKKKYGVK